MAWLQLVRQIPRAASARLRASGRAVAEDTAKTYRRIALFASLAATREGLARSDAVGLYGDDNLSPGVPFFEVSNGLGSITQRVGPVDDWRDLAGLEKLAQDG